mgnify:CR=1 FL=1
MSTSAEKLKQRNEATLQPEQLNLLDLLENLIDAELNLCKVFQTYADNSYDILVKTNRLSRVVLSTPNQDQILRALRYRYSIVRDIQINTDGNLLIRIFLDK